METFVVGVVGGKAVKLVRQDGKGGLYSKDQDPELQVEPPAVPA